MLLKYDAEITGAEVIVNGLCFFQKKYFMRNEFISLSLDSAFKNRTFTKFGGHLDRNLPVHYFFFENNYIHIWQIVKTIENFKRNKLYEIQYIPVNAKHQFQRHKTKILNCVGFFSLNMVENI